MHIAHTCFNGTSHTIDDNRWSRMNAHKICTVKYRFNLIIQFHHFTQIIIYSASSLGLRLRLSVCLLCSCRYVFSFSLSLCFCLRCTIVTLHWPMYFQIVCRTPTFILNWFDFNFCDGKSIEIGEMKTNERFQQVDFWDRIDTSAIWNNS